MSDESGSQNEPRLKLKLRSDKTPGQAPASPAPPPAAAVPEPGTAEQPAAAQPSVKLKPRITIKPAESEPASEAAPAPSQAAEPMNAPVAAPGEELPPISSAASAAPETPAAAEPEEPASDGKAEGVTKFKLKPRGGAQAAPAQTAPENPPAESSAKSSASLPPIPIPTAVTAAPPPPSGLKKAAPAPKARKMPRFAVPAIAGIILLAAGAVAYLKFTAAPKPVPAAQPASSSGPAAGKTTPAPVAQPPAAPKPSGGPAPAEAQAAPTPPAREISKPPADAGPSLQFRAYVDHLKIGGVRAGPPPRLFIGGLTLRPGDVMEPTLGVVFVGLDAATGEIIFKDSTGAVLRRRF